MSAFKILIVEVYFGSQACIWKSDTGEIVAQCEVKICKTNFGQFFFAKQVNVGMVAWSPDGKQLAVLRSDVAHEVNITGQLPSSKIQTNKDELWLR